MINLDASKKLNFKATNKNDVIVQSKEYYKI